MAKTLLNGVNEVLVDAKILDSAGLLTTLTSSARQNSIDIAVQIWNEMIGELYSSAEMGQPQEVAEDSIVLADADRSYTLATDLNQLRWPLHDETNGQYITSFPGGYEALRRSQPQPNNYTGTPSLGAINPIDGEVYLDRVPVLADVGKTYGYLYDKDLELTLAADTMPFDDDVFRAMVPAVSQMFQRRKRQDFDPNIFSRNFGQAARRLTKQQVKTSWLPR